MTLAEIIEEYDRREALIAGLLPGAAKADECRARDAFARRHSARLIAVAKAAVEMRGQFSSGDYRCKAFDAAAGEGKETT